MVQLLSHEGEFEVVDFGRNAEAGGRYNPPTFAEKNEDGSPGEVAMTLEPDYFSS